MIKRDEIRDPKSCINKARDDEMLFVLLGRDPAASAAIHAWIEERINLGLNLPEDAKIQEAIKAACDMGKTGEKKRPNLKLEDQGAAGEKAGLGWTE
jgi:hypothetical protein